MPALIPKSPGDISPNTRISEDLVNLAYLQRSIIGKAVGVGGGYGWHGYGKTGSRLALSYQHF